VYSLGPHTFTVTYNGDTAKTPLVLGSLVIQNGTASGSTTGSASAAQATDTTTTKTPAIVGGVIGGVIGGVVCLLIVIFLVLYRRRRRSNKERREDVDGPTDYIPASQVIPYAPPSRLPAKVLEANASSLGHRPRPSDPSSIFTPESTTYLFGSTIASDGQHSRNPSGSHGHIAVDSISGAATSTFVVHRDSGARLPQVTPRPLVDIPPAYTPE